MRIETRYAIDYSRGRSSYGKRLWGFTSAKRRKTLITIDLGRNWRAAEFEARRQRKSVFRAFVAELLETLDHEYVHTFERAEFPRRWISIGERGAEIFAMYGRFARG